MVIIGTPSACFLPARQYEFNYITGLVSLEVPVRGEFPEESPRAGEVYDICPEEGQVLFGTLLEVFFAFRKYPALEEGQHFVISAIESGSEVVAVIGRVIEGVKN